MNTKQSHNLTTTVIVSAIVACFATASAFAGGGVVAIKAPSGSAGGAIDYANAKPIPLPQSLSQPSSQLDSLLDAQAAGAAAAGPSGFYPGAAGTGKLSPLTLPAPASALDVSEDGGVTPQEYGTSKQVYTTSRTNNYYGAGTYAATRSYPFSAAGRLWFKIGTASYVCSASLVKKGVIVTAAHCVANFGKKQFYTAWQFAPGYDNNVAPFGISGYKAAYIKTSYYDGSDSCYQSGVVCQNDVAVIVLNTTVGNSTGWLGYGYGNYNYVNNQALITQLGYPVALDRGILQERTDSQGYVSSSMAGNTIIGSLQTGGSSGGPWITNLGIAPSLSGTAFGSGASHNAVVGVTSWGYTADAVKQQGASPFTSNNIQSLITSACTAYPASC